MKTILHIDASGRGDASASRQLSAQIVDTIKTDDASITYRDVGNDLPFLNDTMIASYFTPPEERSDELKQAITQSDDIVQELMDHDHIVIGMPIYNFSMPAAFKAWADLAARAGVTFKYTDQGPVGLLENKRAYVVITSGGVPLDSSVDFLTPWVRQFLGFLGISDVTIVDASQTDASSLEQASNTISGLAA